MGVNVLPDRNCKCSGWRNRINIFAILFSRMLKRTQYDWESTRKLFWFCKRSLRGLCLKAAAHRRPSTRPHPRSLSLLLPRVSVTDTQYPLVSFLQYCFCTKWWRRHQAASWRLHLFYGIIEADVYQVQRVATSFNLHVEFKTVSVHGFVPWKKALVGLVCYTITYYWYDLVKKSAWSVFVEIGGLA